MKKISLLIFTLFFQLSFTQIGIVTDSDGFVNVRKSKGGQKIDTLNEGAVFFVDVEDVEIMDSTFVDSNWISIDYYKDSYNTEDKKNGFVHKSRIKPIYQLGRPDKNIPKLIFDIDKVGNPDQEFSGPYNLPPKESNEIDGINISIDNKLIQLDKKFYKNTLIPFLRPNLYSSAQLVEQGKMFIYQYKSFYYYRMKLGDASEYCEVVWVVKNGEIIQSMLWWIT